MKNTSMTSAPTPPTPTTPNKQVNILLFGETGNGKSSLGNHLLGLDAFRVSDDIDSETKITFGRKGEGNNSNLFVIDTPGLMDTKGNDKEHMIQLVEYIREHKELNAIIVVFNYQQVRFPYNIQTMLKLFCNIFPMKEVGNHVALVFTNSFKKRGNLTQEDKSSKLEKILPAFRKVIEESSGSKLANNITTGFVDMDPKEGIDENGKADLNRIITWASFLPNLNVESFKTPEPDVKIETQEFSEMRIEGEYIINTKIKKEREVYCQLDGSISYGEWKEKEREEEKVVNPEIENLKKLNLDNEQMLKRIQEDNEKKMKELKEENEKIQEKAHKQFLEMMASNKKSEDEMVRLRQMRLEEERRIRDEYEKRIKEERDELKRAQLERELQEKKEKEKEREKRRKYYEKMLLDIKNNAKNSNEAQRGECSKDHISFSAGITEENELIKEAHLSEADSVFKSDWGLGYQEKTFERAFSGKTIVGWRLKSNHGNEKGGSWERKSEVLGTSSYSFCVYSFLARGCNWKLSIWVVDNMLPIDFE